MAQDYDLIVIGAGSAGLTAAVFAGNIGARVALIEADKIGGDCTHVGCVPSKALLKIARVAHAARTASSFGVHGCGDITVDMRAVRDQIQQVVANVYAEETPDAVRARGVTQVIEGRATFVDAHTVEVNGQRITGRKFIVAVGSRPRVPKIEGLADVPYHTNETIFANDRLPQHLIVIGAGPIGVEMGQAYARLGARVTLVDEQFMANDEPEVREVLRPILAREGADFTHGLVARAARDGDDIVLTTKGGDVLRGDMLLVAVGRQPNVAGVGLDAAGVAYTDKGVTVDDHLRTNVPHIWAVGDCTGGPQFTHLAGWQGAQATRNALLPGRTQAKRPPSLPWCTFTEPEAAHTGLLEREARAQYGDGVRVQHFSLEHGDRAQAEQDTDGFIKVVMKPGGVIVGATIVADRAGEMINEYTRAVANGWKPNAISGLMHVYPSYGDMVQKASSQEYVRTLLGSLPGQLLKRFGRPVYRL